MLFLLFHTINKRFEIVNFIYIFFLCAFFIWKLLNHESNILFSLRKRKKAGLKENVHDHKYHVSDQINDITTNIITFVSVNVQNIADSTAAFLFSYIGLWTLSFDIIDNIRNNIKRIGRLLLQ